MRNGNVERVFNAVSQGVTDRKAMATWLALDQQAVDNALKRLIDGKRVRREGKAYVVNAAPAIARVW